MLGDGDDGLQLSDWTSVFAKLVDEFETLGIGLDMLLNLDASIDL